MLKIETSTTPPYDSLVEGTGNYRVSDGTGRSVWDINPFMTGCMEEPNEFLLGCRAKIPVCLRDSLLPTRG